ncbi:sulfotransferase domain-containing protein [Brevundimonas sp. PAMC22021]|uniref:sulfotransferase domain-containing protein n=1 Tax=Brevundimonas sp. PAMC22021 TaxID=2861285 RepID=UPI001C630C67|nr:sulfotransferase domain-containing protein [Brevundimonas sp. PAMC22021]QYF86427.1 sulfotransferase [Brevundimonas sp. PAMC22021]
MSMQPSLFFVVGGAQKCGTTALDAYLRFHPQLEMARTKETHFFDDEEGVNWRDPDYGPLHAQFSDRQDVLRGEATPISLYWTPAHHRILRYNPEMRFIFMLRHPTERAWSHWRMNIRRELDHLPFGEAIRAGRLRVLEDGEHSGLARHSSYVERGYYGRQIQSLATLFPLENMLVLRQTDLSHDPDAVLSRVARFLGVDPFPAIDPLIANVGAVPDDAVFTPEDRAYLDDLFAEDLKRLTTLTGVDLTAA